MSVFATPTTWTGWFKRVYSNEVLDKLVPEVTQFTKSVKFKQEKKLGDTYEQPVIRAYEQGMTRGGSAGDAFALNAAVTGETGNARVAGYENTLTGRISKATIERSSTSEAAFGKGTQLKIKSMMFSHARHLEADLLFGQDIVDGAGVISSTTGSSTTRTVVFTDATWSGLWLGSKGMQVDVTAAASATVINTSAITVSSVNLAAKSVVFSGTDGALGLTELETAGRVIHLRGASVNACLGLFGIARTSSGNLFGLATDNETWEASTYDVAGAFGFNKALDMANQAWERGLEGRAILMLSGKTFTKLNINEAALRKYDMSYSKEKAENGVEKLVFHGHYGDLEVMVHRFCKEGRAIMYNPKELVRIGSYDKIKFDDGTPDAQVFYRIEGYQGYELRSYSDQALFSEAPSHIVLATGITN
jgi:hypothetical protein